MPSDLHSFRAHRLAWLQAALIVSVLGLLLMSVTLGVAGAPPESVPGLIWQGWLERHAPDADMRARIVFGLRLPRALAALCVGAALAVVGLLLQTVSHNGLADPYTFGLSSGAAAGAVLIITTVGDIAGIWSLPLAAFTGGVLAAATVMLLMRRARSHSPERLVLAGLAVSFLFSSLTYLMTFLGDQRAAQSVLFWTLGGFGAARWDNLPIALTGAVLALGLAAWRHRQLDALLAGEATAHSLGIQPARLQRQVFLTAALATACCVAVAGVIGFIGLMAPHLARIAAGALHRQAIGLCALIGATMMLLGDVLARHLMAPQELPVGVLIALVGACFVIALITRRD